MAEALIKYETIDKDQIDDIMNGKPPRPPSDWVDDNDTPDGTSSSPEKKESKGDGQIGDPAGQH